MKTTTLGRGGPAVSRVGLGLMGMSGIYGPAQDDESIVTIRAALDAGITLLDTGDFYGMGHNEMLLGRALRSVPRDSVFIQIKFGAQRDPGGAFAGYDASPPAVKTWSLPRSRRRCPRMRSPATGTTSTAWPPWTASALPPDPSLSRHDHGPAVAPATPIP